LSLGQVAWLQASPLDFEELAGARVFRPSSVPGVRWRPSQRSPLDLGVGALLALPALSTLPSRPTLAGLLQLGAIF
jgi:hypothetical protein